MTPIAGGYDRSNGITPLRLGLALLVVFSHAYPAGGFGTDDLAGLTGGQMELGTVAVIGFFGLSGFLLTQSRLGSSLARYTRRRVLRIVPGLWVCLAFLGLVAVPLAIRLGGHASPTEVAHYAVSVAAFQPFPVTIDGLYPGSGYPSLVNVPLWTLPWEVYLYAAIGLIGIGGRRAMRTLCPPLLVAAIVANVAFDGSVLELYGHLPVAFLAGSCLYLYRVPIRRELAVAAVVVTVISAALGLLSIASPITLVYLALYIGMRLPLRWSLDLSFGVYIYGWLVQALLAEAGLASLGVWPYVGVSLLPILALAYLSANFVEGPFMTGLVGTPRRRRAVAIGST